MISLLLAAQLTATVANLSHAMATPENQNRSSQALEEPANGSALLTATLALPLSKLADESHSHEWDVIEHIEKFTEEVVLLDRADQPDYVGDDETFQTVLMRGAEMDGSGQLYFIDARMAIDCDRVSYALVAISKPVIGDDWTKNIKKPFGEFEPLDNDPRDEDIKAAVFEHVCGRQWSYTNPQ